MDPVLLTESIRAPCASNNRATSVWPFCAAADNGVEPLSVEIRILLPHLRRNFNTYDWGWLFVSVCKGDSACVCVCVFIYY